MGYAEKAKASAPTQYFLKATYQFEKLHDFCAVGVHIHQLLMQLG
jgi:hypothetical protein